MAPPTVKGDLRPRGDFLRENYELVAARTMSDAVGHVGVWLAARNTLLPVRRSEASLGCLRDQQQHRVGCGFPGDPPHFSLGARASKLACFLVPHLAHVRCGCPRRENVEQHSSV